MPSLYIVLEKKLSGFDDYVNGHALYDALHALNPMADQLGIRPFMAFYGQAPKPAAKAIDVLDSIDSQDSNDSNLQDGPAEESDVIEENANSEEAIAENDPSPPPQQETWFLISEGLRTVNGYLGYLKRSAYAIPNTPLIKKELLEWQRVLYLASQELRLWHLAVS